MFPAHAGMSRKSKYGYPDANHVPRTRGDEPLPRKGFVLGLQCSPHTRGCAMWAVFLLGLWIFPAHTGINRLSYRIAGCGCDGPPHAGMSLRPRGLHPTFDRWSPTRGDEPARGPLVTLIT